VNSFAFAVINAGVAGCCTGLALSFPGISYLFIQIDGFALFLKSIRKN